MNSIYWKNSLLKTIDVLSLQSMTQAGIYEVGYCTGITQSGEHVFVTVPFKFLTKGTIKEEILKFAKDENVFAKGLGIFEAINIKEQIPCIHGNSELRTVTDFTFYVCKDCGFQSKQPPTG